MVPERCGQHHRRQRRHQHQSIRDCNDARADISPAATETCDNIDQDCRYDNRNADHRTMVAAFRNSDAGRALERDRPGPNATAAERGRWEERCAREVVGFINANVRYPSETKTDAQLNTMRARRIAHRTGRHSGM